jgi:hypothetical protein
MPFNFWCVLFCFKIYVEEEQLTKERYLLQSTNILITEYNFKGGHFKVIVFHI